MKWRIQVLICDWCVSSTPDQDVGHPLVPVQTANMKRGLKIVVNGFDVSSFVNQHEGTIPWGAVTCKMSCVGCPAFQFEHLRRARFLAGVGYIVTTSCSTQHGERSIFGDFQHLSKLLPPIEVPHTCLIPIDMHCAVACSPLGFVDSRLQSKLSPRCSGGYFLGWRLKRSDLWMIRVACINQRSFWETFRYGTLNGRIRKKWVFCSNDPLLIRWLIISCEEGMSWAWLIHEEIRKNVIWKNLAKKGILLHWSLDDSLHWTFPKKRRLRILLWLIFFYKGNIVTNI